MIKINLKMIQLSAKKSHFYWGMNLLEKTILNWQKMAQFRKLDQNSMRR